MEEPARSLWKKLRNELDMTSTSSTCIELLLMCASMVASETCWAVVAPPAWFQAQAETPNWPNAGNCAAQSNATASPAAPTDASWLRLVEELKAVMAAPECSAAASTRKEFARAFIVANMVSVCFSFMCITVMLLSKRHRLKDRAQAESRLRCLLWALLWLLLAKLAEAAAVSVARCARSKIDDVHVSAVTALWEWWTNLAVHGALVLFFLYRFRCSVQEAQQTWQLDMEQVVLPLGARAAAKSTDEVRITPS
jgi:hypothetical protein